MEHAGVKALGKGNRLLNLFEPMTPLLRIERDVEALASGGHRTPVM
jgi:hypothetical protein